MSPGSPPPGPPQPGPAPIRRLVLAALSNMASQAVGVLTLIVIAPIVLHRVGAASFGVWVLVGSVGSFGFLLDLGVSAAVVKNVAQQAAAGAQDQIARVLAAAALIYTVMAAVLALGGLVLWVLLPLVITGSGPVARLAPPLAALIGADIAVSLIGIPSIGLLRGLQRFPVLGAVNAFWAVAGAVLTVIVLEAGGGIVAVAGVGAINSLLTTVNYVILARRIDRRFAPWPRRDGPTVRRLVRFSRSVSVIQLSGVLQGRLDAVVIGAALPVRLLAPYNFAQRLASGAEIVTDQFSKLLLPYASEVSTAGRAPLRRVFLTGTRISLTLAIGAAIPLALLGGPILRLWAGAGFGAYGDVVALLVTAAVVDLASHPCAAVLQSIDRHGPVAWMALAGGLANVVLSIALVGPLGLRGVAVATLIATAAEIGLLVIPYATRVLEVTAGDFAREVIAPILAPATVLAGLVLAGHALLAVSSLPRLALVVAVALVGYAAAYATAGAPAPERSVYAAAARSVREWPARSRAGRHERRR